MRHFASEIIAAEMRASDNVPELTVSFLGLTGPSGIATRASLSDGIHPGVISHGQFGAALAAAIR